MDTRDNLVGSGIFGSISSLLWFIYRVIFQIIPAMCFWVVFILLLHKYYCKFDIYYYLCLLKCNLGLPIWLIFLIISFATSQVFEAFTCVIQRFLRFREKTKTYLAEHMKELDVLMKKKEILDIYIEHINSSDISGIGKILFNLGIQKSLKNMYFNTHFWFLITREFLISSVAISIIIIVTVFLPLLIYPEIKECSLFKEKSEIILYSIYVIQIVLTGLGMEIIRGLLHEEKKKVPNLLFEEKKYRWGTAIVLLLILSLCTFFNNAILFFITANIICFCIIGVLFRRAFREYLHVEIFLLTLLCEKEEKKEEKEMKTVRKTNKKTK